MCLGKGAWLCPFSIGNSSLTFWFICNKIFTSCSGPYISSSPLLLHLYPILIIFFVPEGAPLFPISGPSPSPSEGLLQHPYISISFSFFESTLRHHSGNFSTLTRILSLGPSCVSSITLSGVLIILFVHWYFVSASPWERPIFRDYFSPLQDCTPKSVNSLYPFAELFD